MKSSYRLFFISILLSIIIGLIASCDRGTSQIDLNPPTITISVPEEGDIVAHHDTIYFKGNVTDQAAVSIVDFTLRDSLGVNIFKNGHKEPGETSYDFDEQITNNQDVDGNFTFTVTATDALGNKDSSKVHLRLLGP